MDPTTNGNPEPTPVNRIATPAPPTPDPELQAAAALETRPAELNPAADFATASLTAIYAAATQVTSSREALDHAEEGLEEAKGRVRERRATWEKAVTHQQAVIADCARGNSPGPLFDQAAQADPGLALDPDLETDPAPAPAPQAGAPLEAWRLTPLAKTEVFGRVICRTLARAGVRTVGDLLAFVQTRPLISIQGIGPDKAQALAEGLASWIDTQTMADPQAADLELGQLLGQETSPGSAPAPDTLQARPSWADIELAAALARKPAIVAKLAAAGFTKLGPLVATIVDGAELDMIADLDPAEADSLAVRLDQLRNDFATLAQVISREALGFELEAPAAPPAPAKPKAEPKPKAAPKAPSKPKAPKAPAKAPATTAAGP